MITLSFSEWSSQLSANVLVFPRGFTVPKTSELLHFHRLVKMKCTAQKVKTSCSFSRFLNSYNVTSLVIYFEVFSFSHEISRCRNCRKLQKCLKTTLKVQLIWNIKHFEQRAKHLSFQIAICC